MNSLQFGFGAPPLPAFLQLVYDGLQLGVAQAGRSLDHKRAANLTGADRLFAFLTADDLNFHNAFNVQS